MSNKLGDGRDHSFTYLLISHSPIIKHVFVPLGIKHAKNELDTFVCLKIFIINVGINRFYRFLDFENLTDWISKVSWRNERLN